MLSAALSRLVLICNFFEEIYFYHLPTYFLACFYEKHLKFHILHLFSLRLSRSVEALPICKSRDDRVDIRFRNVSLI